MARIVVGTGAGDSRAFDLKSALEATGNHDVVVDDDLIDSSNLETTLQQDIASGLRDRDAFICYYNEDDSSTLRIARIAIAYARESGRLLVALIFEPHQEVPQELAAYALVRGPGMPLDALVSELDQRIANFVGRSAARQQRAAETAAKIEKNSSEYIDEVIASQRAEASKNRFRANVWYALGFLSLIGGVAIVLLEMVSAIPTPWHYGMPGVLFGSIRTLVAIGLLSACGKYAFTLGKSYANESLKNVDRIHAISFGRFYLRAFGDRATWSEVQDVFQHWNIDRSSTFSTLKASDFDPRLVEMVTDVLKSAVEKLDVPKLGGGRKTETTGE